MTIGNLLDRISAQALYLPQAERELSLLTESAEERYLKFPYSKTKLFLAANDYFY